MRSQSRTILPDVEATFDVAAEGDVTRTTTIDGDGETAALPRLDIRVVLFTVVDAELRVALREERGTLRLARGVPRPTETLDAAARRIVRSATGLQEQYLEQLYTLSVPDAAEWTVIVSYLGLLRTEPAAVAPAGGWYEVTALPDVSAADRMVIDYALVRLRAKLGYTNVAFHLLPHEFTLSELQRAYETILGRRLDKRNFRRRVTAAGILSLTGGMRREGSHRPAALYRFRPGDDREAYLTPPWAAEA